MKNSKEIKEITDTISYITYSMGFYSEDIKKELAKSVLELSKKIPVIKGE